MERTPYIVTAQPAEQNVAAVRVKVRATSTDDAEARARKVIEGGNNHLTRLSMGPRPAVRLASIRYTAVKVEGTEGTGPVAGQTRTKRLPDGTTLNVTLHDSRKGER